MKSKLKYVKKAKDELTAINELFNTYLEKINKEHNNILLKEFSNMIHEIAIGENLDEEDLRNKYLKVKKSKKITKESNEDDQLLDKIIIDDNEYYYQNKENGFIFNSKSEKVGSFLNNELIFN